MRALSDDVVATARGDLIHFTGWRLDRDQVLVPSATGSPTVLTWDEQATATGPGVVYDTVGGNLSALPVSGLNPTTTSCLSGDLTTNSATDSRPSPPVGDGYFYLARARNTCATGGFGLGRSSLDPLSCAAP